jgi:TM2 domain-containing membrane protein YozV
MANHNSGGLSPAGIAAIFSFILPGTGQLYNGKFLRAIFWFIVTPGLWIGSGGTLGWIFHIISSYTAYNWAKRDMMMYRVVDTEKL